MFDAIETLFKKRNILTHKNQGITVAKVLDSTAGVELTKEILHQIIDRKTVLYLSGGSTPKSLYTEIAREELLIPGAVGQVDERFGEPFHPNSNQLMIRGTGLLRYLEIRDIPFYPILQSEKSREEAADLYDQKLRELNAVFQKSVAIMGIGIDGHTSGMPALDSEFRIQNSELLRTHNLVASYNDTNGKYDERVTMTFLGLEMIDLLIVLVFGDDKNKALDLMFGDGSEEEIPARFYKRPDVAKKTLLITDQTV